MRNRYASWARRATSPLFILVCLALCNCSSGKQAGDDDDGCFPDNDGFNGKTYTIDLTVSDDGFSKNLLDTQNESTVTFTLTNSGSVPHGFEVDCMSVSSGYPDLPAGCPDTSCFPEDSLIAPIMPGESTTITFVTPVPDNIIYPFKSSSPDDATVAGLNGGQWALM